MRRRELVPLALVLLGNMMCQAAGQPLPGAKPARIGILSPAPSDQTSIFNAFRQGLRDVGYFEGRNLSIQFRSARGDAAMLPRLAAELVRERVDVILTDGAAAAQAAKQATSAIPVVMGTSGADPVALGLVASMSRPGGNITGFTLAHAPLSAKRLDLMRAIFPAADTFSVLLNPHAGSEANFRAVEEAARALGSVKLMRVEAATPEALRVLSPQTFRRETPLVVLPDAMFWNNRQTIVTLLSIAGVPALYPEREYVDDGGLIAYGPNVPDNFRRAADYVGRILEGANPGDLPIQEPVKIDLVINLRTARTQGVDIPLSLLGRADEVIE
jgi:putative tryptophan/tyrosine transport system substrate-binding protein